MALAYADSSPRVEPAPTIAFPATALWYDSYNQFFRQLRDDKGQPLDLLDHVIAKTIGWADVMQENELLVLLAARDHAKTWTLTGYLLWKAWRHNRDRMTGLLLDEMPDGQFQAVVFSETKEQVKEFMQRLQGMLLANLHLFGDLMPDFRRGKAQRRGVWSTTKMRLKNDFEVTVRAYRTSTRGMHPDLILLDDVLSEKNSLTAYQRRKTWNYFTGTLLPMNPKQMIVIGCLATGTPVLMADGTSRAIERVRVGEEVWAVNTRGEFQRRKVEAVLDQGVAETVEVVTDRSTVRATPWHPFLVASGVGGNLTWRRADELHPGDRVVELKEIPGAAPVHEWIDAEFMWLLGYLFGDGWVTSDRLSICAAIGVRQEVNDRVLALLRDWFPTVEFKVVPFGPHGGYIRGDSRPVARALADLGLAGKAKTKRVPDWVFGSLPEHRRAFLRGVVAADGTRQARSTDSYRVEMANEGLVRDIRGLAMGSGLRVGLLQSRTRTSQAPHSPVATSSTTWSLSLNFATVGVREGRHKGTGRTYEKLGTHARFGRVVEVRPTARTQVWDLTVEGTHSFIADGLAVHNTPQHYDDLLFRLKPDLKKPPLTIGNKPVRFKWVKYKAVDWDTGQVLWEARHNLDNLKGLQALDPLSFSREYQLDPRDDASSMFPFTLTQKALDQGAMLTFVANYDRLAGDFIILGADFAESEEIAADDTVIMVWVWSRVTQKRRMLWGVKAHGASFETQMGLLRYACGRYRVDLGVVEENGFQKWLYVESKKWPETAGRLFGHRTGAEKSNFEEGVPSLKLSLLQELWIMPSGDAESLEFAREWQAQLNAFGWKDGRLQGVGEHDDFVMAQWFSVRAIRLIEELINKPPDEQIVTGAEEGVERVTISADY